MTKSNSQKPRTSRNQLILIGALGVFLVAVLWNNFVPKETSEPTDTDCQTHCQTELESNIATSETKRNVCLIGRPPAAVSLPSTDIEASLPAIHIDQLLSHNPFLNPHYRSKVPASHAPSAVGQRQTSPNPKQEWTKGAELAIYPDNNTPIAQLGKVTAIVTGGERPAAMINDQVYFVNDLVGATWRILAIQPSSITVEAVPSE